MIISQDVYLDHPYYKKIIDYFDHVELINSLSRYYAFKIHDLDLTDQSLRETEFIKNEDEMIDYVDDRMKYLVASVILSMMKKHGFDYYESNIDLNTGTNNITVSLNKYDCQKKIVNKIEKIIGGERLVFKHEISIDGEIENNDICDYRSVELFKINLDNFSFEEIENQLEKYTKIKDQIILTLRSM